MEWLESTATPTSRHNFHSETRRYQHLARAGGGHLLAGKLTGIPGWAGCPNRGSRIHLSDEQTARRPDAQQSSVNQATQSHHGSIGSVTERSTNNMCLWERPQWQHRAEERAFRAAPEVDTREPPPVRQQLTVRDDVEGERLTLGSVCQARSFFHWDIHRWFLQFKFS